MARNTIFEKTKAKKLHEHISFCDQTYYDYIECYLEKMSAYITYLKTMSSPHYL